MKRRGIVVGAGVSGLAAARAWLRAEPSIDLEVLEAGEAPGGVLRTLERDGFVIELGPDAILTEKPAALELVRGLGIEDRVVTTRPENRGAYVVSRGRLAKVPSGFSMMAPVEPWSFLGSNVVGLGARLRAGLLEPMIPRRKTGSEESLAHFVRRRFGAEVLERLAQPLASGIYGSDAETLSLEATMPRFPTMERERGSIVRALRAKAREARGGEESASGARYGLFIAFDRGMQVLSDALERSVGDRIRLRAPVRAVVREGARWRVACESGTSEVADAVVIATSARRAASMLRDLDPLIHDGLDTLPHGSAATVTFAWKESEIPQPLDAYGFVVPAVERRTILASTWASAKWPGRAPAGWALIRVFVGGMHAEDVAERDDAALIATARRELRALMGIDSQPAFSIVTRFTKSMPVYRVGHLERVASLEAHLGRFPGLALAGNGLRGVGIPDAIASGNRAAGVVAIASSE